MKPFALPDEPIGFQMAPLIDIVFLLIIFFMVAANINQVQRVKIDMAEATEARAARDPSFRIFITVDREGNLFLGARPTTLEELGAQLPLEYRANPNVRVFLRADKTTKHGAVKSVLKLCADAGIYDIIFATHEKS